MKTAKSNLTGIYAQSIGIEAARELIAKKIDAAALEDKESYTEEEIIRICNELLKEGDLIGIVAQTFLIQLEYRKSEEQRLLLDNIDTQIWYLADIGTCGAVNKARAEFFGMDKEDLEGRNLRDVLSREESEVCADGDRKVFEKKKQIRTEEWIKNGRGKPRLLSITKTPKLNDDGDVEYVICAAEDITERKLAEEREKRSYRNIEFLSETAMEFVEFSPDRDIYHLIGERLQELVGDSFVAINSIDESGNTLTTRAVVGVGDFFKDVMKLLGRNPEGMKFDATDKDLSYLSDGALHNSRRSLYGIMLHTSPKLVCEAIEKIFNIGKIYTIGFIKENRLLGTAAIFLPKGAEIEDKITIEAFIKQASIALQREMAEEQITRLNSVLRAIRNVNELLVTEKDRNSLLRKSCDALIDARGYDAVWLSLFENGERFVEVVGSGFQEDISRFSRHVISGDNPPCIRDALASEETVLVRDKSRWCKDCFFKDACRGRAAIILRVEHAGRFFGLLAVLLAPDVAVDDEEKSLLAEVASDIAIGLHDIEMMGILREREQIVRKQNEMLMELAKCKELYSGDLADSLRIVTEATARAVAVERVSVWLYGDDRSMIRCIDLYTMSTDSHSEGMVLAAADYPSYFEALEEGAFIAAHDAHKDPRTKEFSNPYLSPLGITSMLDVPIRLKGDVMGVVCYEHVGPARRWTMEEENFARSPADYISLAMEADERRRAEDALRHATLSLQEHVVMLEESNTRAEEASRLREYFLKETSHRIITPVTIVGGYSKWLLRWSNNLDKNQEAKIRLICEKNEEIQTLVRDALEEKYLADIE